MKTILHRVALMVLVGGGACAVVTPAARATRLNPNSAWLRSGDLIHELASPPQHDEKPPQLHPAQVEPKGPTPKPSRQRQEDPSVVDLTVGLQDRYSE